MVEFILIPMVKRDSKGSVPQFTYEQALAFRTRRHYLAKQAAKKDLVKVAAQLGGVQAQVYSAAQASLAARVKGITPDDIEKALWVDKTLAKVWSLRWTVHIIPSEDIPLYTGALRLHAETVIKWETQLGLKVEDMEALLEKVLVVLKEGPLTRKQILARFENSGLKFPQRWITSGWGGAIKIGVMRGDVLFGPSVGQETTFVRRDKWIPKQKNIPEKKARNELLTRYLAAYGPAQPVDFGYWTGFKSGPVKETFAAIGMDLIEVDLEGKQVFMLKDDLDAIKSRVPKRPVVRLLPNFDVYLLGQKEKWHIVDREHYKKVYRKAGWISSVILVDGRVAGVWGCERKGKRVVFTTEPFGKLSREVKDGIGEEVLRIAKFKWECDDVVIDVKK